MRRGGRNYIDKTGQRIGILTVLRRAPNHHPGQNKTRVRYDCVCDCGSLFTATSANLGRCTFSCGCLGRSKGTETKQRNFAGSRFGRLTVIRFVPADDRRKGRWLCKCDCGKEALVLRGNLTLSITTSCGCYRQEQISKPLGWAGLSKIFSEYQTGARNRNLVWDLDRATFETLTKLPCHYCGVAFSRKVGKPGREYICNGVDRVDNTAGYLPDNCVPCCQFCNIAKGTLTTAEFLEHIRRVAAHNTPTSEIPGTSPAA
jgi:hypothetical protein